MSCLLAHHLSQYPMIFGTHLPRHTIGPFKSLTSPRRDDRVLADIPLFAPPGDALFSGAVEGSLEDGDLEPMYCSSESSILTMCSFISSGMYFNICQRLNCFLY